MAASGIEERGAIAMGIYSDMSDLTSPTTFVTSFAGHIAAEAAL